MAIHIETDAVQAHITGMTAAVATKRPSPAKKSVYRGVTLQRAAPERTRFSLAQLKKAVETAVAKNADALSGSK
ncbi:MULTISPECIES: hypothetical protein [Brevundimonas]|uniref:hypothetical protein n=1 Tax=Brevundimonas TaxID=41275 RepID=UPI0019076E08|nr:MULTISPECIES: hypothetical protein [Brevundimonas]